MTIDEVMTQFVYAVEAFNNEFDYNFSVDNFVICGIDNGADREKVFEEFCSEYFPFRLGDNYKCDEYYNFIASAFPGKKPEDKQGILFRTDIKCREDELYHILLHELSHIYCVHNELGGKIFFDEYCIDYAIDKETEGQINAGYAVWREYIADMLAGQCEDEVVNHLYEKTDILLSLKNKMNNSSGKLCVSKILFEVMSSVELLQDTTWEDAKQSIVELELFDNPAYINMFELIFLKMKSCSIEIDIDFISELGGLYLLIMMMETPNQLKINYQ